MENEAKTTGEFYSELHWRNLEKYREETTKLLTKAVGSSQAKLVEDWQQKTTHDNQSKKDELFINRLMNDTSITIKPADKNLGLVIVDTSWYCQELQRMLMDRNTYRPFTLNSIHRNNPTIMGKKIALPGTIKITSTFETLKQELGNQFNAMIRKHTSTIEKWAPENADQIIKFLKHNTSPTGCILPRIYLLIKIHKSSGLCGRPIVPSHSWITSSASKVVDHLLQEIVKGADIPWLIRDTKSFINKLETTPFLFQEGCFVTADIASLYTNIDTEMGLRMMKLFLEEQKVYPERIEVIMDLLGFVMKNNYLINGNTIYQQIDGTAMGTQCAPVYATIVVYMKERDTINTLLKERNQLYFYGRYLDDIFAYLDKSIIEEFKTRMNNLHPKLKFDFTVSNDHAEFLDLQIYKGKRFYEKNIVDLRCHQKKMNLYLYLPWHSFHTEAMKKSFIQTELIRYIRNSSNKEDYIQLKSVFFQRLRARGYPNKFLNEIFDTIHYHDREYFLSSLTLLNENPKIHTDPPLSKCLIKRLHREKERELLVAEKRSPLVFIIPYSPLSHCILTRSILCTNWHLIHWAAKIPIPLPIMAYQSLPSLIKILVFMKAKRMEEQKKKEENELQGKKLLQTQLTNNNSLMIRTNK